MLTPTHDRIQGRSFADRCLLLNACHSRASRFLPGLNPLGIWLPFPLRFHLLRAYLIPPSPAAVANSGAVRGRGSAFPAAKGRSPPLHAVAPASAPACSAC